jgi:hypothetical protein
MSQVDIADVSRPTTAGSESTKNIGIVDVEGKDPLTQETVNEKPVELERPRFTAGEGESAIPEDKKVQLISFSTSPDKSLKLHIQEDAIENVEDDWQHDPQNPRNWPLWTKWRMTAIVRLSSVIPFLARARLITRAISPRFRYTHLCRRWPHR